MTSQHSNLLNEDMMFNRSHPVRSSSPNPKFETEDENKAEHIEKLQKEYNKRLIQPLQINSKFKMQAEAAIGSSMGEFKGPRRRILPQEDTERKQLINQVKEIDRISAYHDKEAGIAKRKKRMAKQKSILAQHLQEDLYNYIKAAKDRAIELKKAQIAERKLLLTEGEISTGVLQIKDPKRVIHKQLDVIKAEKDKNLKPKQLNSNSYFRYSERKMLLLRTVEDMETIPQQDKTGKAFFCDEAKKERMRRKPVALLTKKSISYKSNPNDKSANSAIPLQSKPSQDLANSQCSPTATVGGSNPPKNVAFYKAYDLMGAHRGSKNLDAESNEYTTIPSPDISTPTSGQHSKLRFYGHTSNLPMNHHETESHKIEVHSRNMSHSIIGRTSSQGFVLDAKSAEIIEDREGESQTQRNLDGDGSYQDHTLENQDYYNSMEEEQNQSGTVVFNKRPTTNYNPGFGSEKLIRSKYWIISDNKALNMPTQEDLASKKLKESFRKNLLGNIQRTKSQKGSMLTESDNHMSLTIKKWPEINSPAILEPEPIKSNRPGRQLKRIKKKSAKNSRSEHVMTEMDYESYIKELQGDKAPLKEEMQDLLSKYGYEDAMVDPKSFGSNRVVKKAQYSGLLQNSINREKLKKIDKFLRQTSFKSTKAIKVD